MTMPARVRFTLKALLGFAIVVGVLLALPRAYFAYHYPYGFSHCCDKQLGIALLNYARANGGKFPTGGATPESSLSLLYPTYVDANILRGKIVPEDEVQKLLDAGMPLTPATCGWHYVDGLSLPSSNSSGIAIVWDKVGLGHNGERLPQGGHSVVFMDGHTAVISEADWNRFLADQEKAWAAIRKGNEPPLPWLPEH